ncbi:carboxylesterase family protein [Streptomyces capitiformicae]|uniref:Carboxylic ester hydrolase n=1 Tax=Streptomyces capitiformicae TaxID=2014920 RepID=A0A919DMP2_9ACTN|nr:carboxylesterase family protein [Streptomyces capitiformicae]GHE57373.1 carboxylic ester hydrolase [Streptomyces capitiformicae]
MHPADPGPATTAIEAIESVEAEVSGGPVIGRREGPERSVAAFRGVPYVAPPVGPYRFAAPRPHAGWSSPLRTDGPVGTVPPQLPSPFAALMGDPVGPDQTEACLTVNVWAPLTGRGPYPVLVWLPGGSFLTGGADLPRYDGAELAAQEEIVVVLVNYRLGALGFLSPSWAEPAAIEGAGTSLTFRATGESGHVTNAGLLDQIMALRWVRREIHAFGGDPHRITVIGQSAGGQALAALLALPQVRPLFRRAALHSAPLGMPPLSRAEAARTADALLAALSADGNADGIQALRTVPSERILLAQRQILARPRARGDVRPPFQLVADGTVVGPDLLGALRSSPPLHGLDVLAGTTRHECALWYGMDASLAAMTREEVAEEFAGQFGDRAEEALRLYTSGPADRPAAFEELKTDAFFAAPTQEFGDLVQERGAAVRLFRFDWEVPGRYSALRACHCLEIPFLLGRPEARRAPLFADAEPADLSGLRAEVRRLWGSFVRTGSASDAWPQHRRERPAVRVIGGERNGVLLRSLLEPVREALWTDRGAN